MRLRKWPPTALRSMQYVLIPEGRIAGKKATYRFIPGRGVKGTIDQKAPEPYPGVRDAWVMNHTGLPGQGEWELEVTVEGQIGKHTGKVYPFRVAPPPSMPAAVGWVVGQIPFMVFIWFLLRERRRVKQAIQKNQGSWL